MSRAKQQFSFVVILTCLIIEGLCLSAFPRQDNCDLAREEYRRGASLTDIVERLKSFKKVIALCPSLAEAHNDLADCYEKAALAIGKYDQMFNDLLDKAISEYEQAMKLNPDMPAPYFGLGENYVRIGLYERASAMFTKFLQLVSPSHPAGADARNYVDWLQKSTGMSAGDKKIKTRAEIIDEFKKSSSSPPPRLMSIEPFTVPRDRQRFINILFDEWSSKLNREETKQQLNEIGEALSSSDLSTCSFIVEGHTDPRGGYERNQQLSRDRAEAVKNYLISAFKIDEDRIKTFGFGYDRPRFPNDSAANMLQNRRVELLFMEKTEN
ncbi:MAG: OmpA family protein [Thermodesulfobacteriota bacterium]